MSDFFHPLPPAPPGTFATLFFKSTPQGFVDAAFSADSPDNPNPGVTGPVVLTLDIITKETPTWQAEPTQNPVENGATVSDHVRVLPRSLTIEAMNSNAPPFGVRIGFLASSSNAALDTLKFLDAMQQAAEPFDFVSGLAVYRNMVITSLTVDRQATTSQAAKFTMKMQEIVIVSSRVVAIDPQNVDPSAADSAASTQNNGKQTPTPANASQAARASAAFDATSPALDNHGVVIAQ